MKFSSSDKSARIEWAINNSRMNPIEISWRTVSVIFSLKSKSSATMSPSSSFQDESSLSEWRWLFFITAGVNVFTTIVFSICASPSVQVSCEIHLFPIRPPKQVSNPLIPPNRKKWPNKLQVFNSKTYTGMSTGKYFTSGDFLKFPVKTESPTPPPLTTSQQQRK